MHGKNKGLGREAVAVSLLLCHASYTGGEYVCIAINSAMSSIVIPLIKDVFQFQDEYNFMRTIESRFQMKSLIKSVILLPMTA